MISYQHCYTRAKRGTLRTNPNYFNDNSKNTALITYQALLQYSNTNSDTIIIPIFTNEETKAEEGSNTSAQWQGYVIWKWLQGPCSEPLCYYTTVLGASEDLSLKLALLLTSWMILEKLLNTFISLFPHHQKLDNKSKSSYRVVCEDYMRYCMY